MTQPVPFYLLSTNNDPASRQLSTANWVRYYDGKVCIPTTDWRRQRADGELQGLTPQKRGRKPDPQASEIARLKGEIETLQTQLQRAETIIDVQKKLSQLLGLTADESNGIR